MAASKTTTATSESVVEGEQTRGARAAINPLKTASVAAQYSAEELVEISISPLYAPEFSRVMPVVLNGVRLNIPVNGEVYKVPMSFAMEIKQRVRAVDERTKRQERMSNVQENIEHSPGELELFR